MSDFAIQQTNLAVARMRTCRRNPITPAMRADAVCDLLSYDRRRGQVSDLMYRAACIAATGRVLAGDSAHMAREIGQRVMGLRS